MKPASLRTKIMFAAALLTFSYGAGGSRISSFSRPVSPPSRIFGHVPRRAIAEARWRGRLPSDKRLSLTLALPLRNQEELQATLARLYDPADPLYGHYLSTQEFVERFGPSQADYDAVAGYVRGLGLTVVATHPNRLLLDVSGPAATVEAAFNLQIHRYDAPGGREFYAPDQNPEVPDFVASRVSGIIGLDNAAVRHHYNHFVAADESMSSIAPKFGTGPGGGLSPSDIATAYNLAEVAADGAGQTLGLFELDGYNPNDVANYAAFYGLPEVPLENVFVDNVSGRAGSGASEVTLDIELQMALAPGSRIVVYEGSNSDTGILRTFNRIASDNVAKQISTSWGLSEALSDPATMTAENAIFQQMAAQGQTLYAAAGDSGAYDSGSTQLSVDDPASQPFVVGTGGTQLFVNSGGIYDHESTWNDKSTRNSAGGGGFSSLWSMPSWQQGVISADSLGSTNMRNVPDISLNADPQTGYSIYYRGRWRIFGGTSCASPLWAAFTARVNQQREINGLGPLGFANPALYQIGAGSRHSEDFHDIADGSTNLFYPAVNGYDDATGWGSFNGANLLADLTSIRPDGLAAGFVFRYYNAQGQPYTNEDVSYWQTADGKWWRGDKTGAITAIPGPPWIGLFN